MHELPRKSGHQAWLEQLISLLERDSLTNIERLTALWRHSAVSKASSTLQTQQLERPGLTYCRDPFQDPQLHQMLHHLNSAGLNRNALLDYLSSGTVAIAREGLDYGVFENFALVVLYLQYYLFSSSSPELESAVCKIKNKEWPVKCYELKQATWFSAFTETNLRVHKCRDSAQEISQSNTYLNELLEYIRLRELDESSLLSTPKLKNEELQKLGKALASCFFAVIEFAGSSDWIVIRNLEILSTNGARLPSSWYSSEFLSTTKRLVERFATQQEVHSTRGLGYVFDLWVFWLRRISGNEHGELGESIIKTMIDTIPMCDGPETSSILLSITTAMSVSLGKFSDDFDEIATQGLIQCMEKSKIVLSADHSDTLFASLAQYLRTTRSKKNITDISDGFFSLAKTLVVKPKERLGLFIKIFRLYQFICTSRIKDFQKTRAAETNKKSAFQIGVVDEASKIQALLASSAHALESDDIMLKNAGFMALAGVVKGYQLSPSSLKLNKEIDNELVSSIKYMTPENPIFSDVETQDLISFVSGQCLSKRQPTKKDGLNIRSLVQVLVNTLYCNDHALSYSYLSPLVYAPPTNNDNYLRAVGALQRRTKHPIYLEIGRISVVLANLLCHTDKPTIQESIEKIRSFAINLYTEMDRCSIEFLVHENNQFKELELPLGDMFKNTVFSVTLIYKTLLERIINDDRAISFAICGDMIESLSRVHYMVVRLGGRGFASYETVTKNLMEKLRNDKEVANKVVKNVLPRRYFDEVETNPLRRSRVLFCFNLIDITMDVLDDDLIKQDILPAIYPYLRTNQYQDMFEASHSIVLSIFENKKKVAGELSAYYSTLILKQYPKYLNIDQLREAYTVMMLGLSQSDDAVAWSCLTKLIQEIEGFSESCRPDQSVQPGNGENSEQNAALYLARGHLLLTLFDQIKSVNLVLLESLLRTIKHLLITEPKSPGRDAICKALYDNVSNGLDYTKKESTIKWYLNLMKDLGENVRP